MDTATPAVAGMPRVLLRIEGACMLAIATVLYWRLGETWWLFAILFLAPDLSFLAYLAGARVGAIAYNVVHTLAGPMAGSGGTRWLHPAYFSGKWRFRPCQPSK